MTSVPSDIILSSSKRCCYHVSKFAMDLKRFDRVGERHHQEKEAAIKTKPVTTPFYRDPIDLTLIVGGVTSLIVMTGVLIAYGRRKRIRNSYEDVPDRSNDKRSSSCSQLSIYGGVSQAKSIEFVVPNLSASTSPGERTALMSVSSQNLPLLCHVSLLDGASSSTNILGGLNPELYKDVPEPEEDEDYPEDNVGRLWFSVEYDAPSERLAIRLIKAKNLPSRVHGTINACDPFVRIFLMPDERRYLQSKTKKKTCNPKFEEIFVFQIPSKALDEYSLRLTVFDSERSKRHKIIGHVFFPLKDVQTTSNLMIWRDLRSDEEQEPSEHGQLLVSLCYNQTLERLTVNVFEAKDLHFPEGNSSMDTYAKVSLLMETKVVKTKKTAVAKRTAEPKYNESFHFGLSIGAVGTASVTIQICLAGGTQKDKCVGRLVLGSPMFARGKANEHWDEAMATNHRQVRYWHKLA